MLEFMPRMPDWTEYFLKMKKWSNANWIVTANLPRNSFIPIKNYHHHHSKHKTGNKQTKTHSSRKAMTTVKACDRVLRNPSTAFRKPITYCLLTTSEQLAARWLSGERQLLPGHLSSIPRPCTHTVEGQNFLRSPDLHTTGEHTISRSN